MVARLVNGAVEATRSRTTLLVLGMFALGMLFGTGAITLSAGGDVAVPAEESYTVGANRVTGKVKFSAGQMFGDAIVSSWDRNRASEDFNIAGTVQFSDVQQVTAYEYRLFFNGEVNDKRTNGWVQVAAYSFKTNAVASHSNLNKPIALDIKQDVTLTGERTGALRAELWVWTNTRCNIIDSCSDMRWERAAQDGLRVISGTGTLTFTKTSDSYEEGETVELNVRTDNGKWRLTLVDGTGKQVCGITIKKTLSLLSWWDGGGWSNVNIKTPPCGVSPWTGPFDGKVQYTIPKGAFVPGGNNVWKFTLDNEIVEHAALKTFVVNKHEQKPGIPSVSVAKSDGTPVPEGTKTKASEPLVFKFSAKENPSGAPISHFLVYIFHGDTDTMPADASDDWIANGVRAEASKTADGYGGSYSFTLKRTANYRAWAVSVDTEARPSGTSQSGDQADEQEKGDPTTNPECPDNAVCGIEDPNTDGRTGGQVDGADVSGLGDDPAGPEASVGAAVAVIAVGMLMAVLVWAYLPAAPVVRLGIVSAICAALLYFSGVFG